MLSKLGGRNLHLGIHLLPYVAGVASFLVLAMHLFRKHRRAVRKTTVVCPAAQLPAEVRSHSDGRIDSCSRLPDTEQCSQSCAPQLQFSADDLSEFTAKYEGKNCASCGTALTKDDWYKSRLATSMADNGASGTRSTPYSPTVSKTKAQPICFACYQANRVV
jgi:hypothetical protein